MALSIQRLNFDPVTGDNPSEAFMKLDLDIGVVSDAINGLGDASSKSVGTTAGTVASGIDPRFGDRGRRNLLFNASLRINQRVFGGGALAANTYGYDLWRTFGAASSFTRSADRTTITLNGTIGQIIEAPDLAGATVTVSVRNPSGAITVNLRPDATTAGVSGTITSGSGLRSVTLVIPSSLTGSVYMQLTTAAAVTFDGSAKQGGIQFEMGSFASNFEIAGFAAEIAACQRQYCKSFLIDTAPATGLSQDTTGQCFYQATGVTTAAARCSTIRFPVSMRASPAITLYTCAVAPSQATGSWTLFNGSTYSNGAVGAAISSSEGFTPTLSFGSGVQVLASYSVIGHWTADASI